MNDFMHHEKNMRKCYLRSRYQKQIGQVSVSLMSPNSSSLNFPKAAHSIYCSIFIRRHRTSSIDWNSLRYIHPLTSIKILCYLSTHVSLSKNTFLFSLASLLFTSWDSLVSSKVLRLETKFQEF